MQKMFSQLQEAAELGSSVEPSRQLQLRHPM
jgi:hypothetical protein